MRFLYGLIGAVLGFSLGGATALFISSAQTDGDPLGIALALTILGPVGALIGTILGVISALRVLRYVRVKTQDKRARRKTALIVGGFVLTVPILVTAMLYSALKYGSPDPPTDQQLLSNFNRHRATFEELARMTQIDKGLQRVDYNWTMPDNPTTVGVSPERIEKYRRLLDSAKVHRGFTADGTGTDVEFRYWEVGSATSSDTEIGYAFLTVAPKQVVSSLDRLDKYDEYHEYEAYRHIQGYWYLYLKYIPG